MRKYYMHCRKCTCSTTRSITSRATRIATMITTMTTVVATAAATLRQTMLIMSDVTVNGIQAEEFFEYSNGTAHRWNAATQSLLRINHSGLPPPH